MAPQRRKGSRRAVPDYSWECRSSPRNQLAWATRNTGVNGRKGHPTLTQLTHEETQDCLSWCSASVRTPVWQQSPHCTQRLPVMGLAASLRWISQGIRRGNTDESQKPRGRGTVLEAFQYQL
jgi:hypothetical protein